MHKGLLTRLSSLFSNTRIGVKLLSFTLALLILFAVLPIAAYAEEIKNLSSENSDEAAANEQSTDVINADESDGHFSYINEVHEVEELREEYTKHFRLEDGSYLAAHYDYPIHYYEDNVYKDIDNALHESSGGVFANSNSRIKFAKKITGNETLFALHDGSYKITMSLIGAKKGTVGAVTNLSDAKDATVLQKMMNLERLSSSILYADILTGVNLEYVAQSLNVKENIIVKERFDSYNYSFELMLNGLSAILSDDGHVLLYDEKASAVKYIIPAPVVFDADGKYAPAHLASYSLTDKNNGKYILSVTVDSSWMNAEERAFPVTIDPTVTATDSGVEDTSIASGNPTMSYGDMTSLFLTSMQHAYWKTTVLPSLPYAAYITDATITMNASLTDGDYVAAYEVLTDWDESLTWEQHADATAPKGKLGDTVIDYNLIYRGYYSWTITPLVQKWYEGENYGVAFDNVPGYSVSLSLISSEHSTAAYRPSLTITYRDMKGLESYWPSLSHSAGVAGNGSINLASGNIVFEVPTLTATDGIFGYTPSLIYNGYQSGEFFTSDAYTNPYTSNEYSSPRGFKWNMQQTVVRNSFIGAEGTEIISYIWVDSDGTEHSFYLSESDNAVYVDEDGLRLELRVSSSAVTITDSNKTVSTFNKINGREGYYLTSVTDVYGNVLQFDYTSYYRPTGVSIIPSGSTAIKLLDIQYNSNGMPLMVVNSASGEAVIFRYSQSPTDNTTTTASSAKFLKEIVYVHCSPEYVSSALVSYAKTLYNTSRGPIFVDATATYTYRSDGMLRMVQDNLNRLLLVYNCSGNRIVYATKGNFDNNAISDQVDIIYGNYYTDVRTPGSDGQVNNSDDIITRYVLDKYGRLSNQYSRSAASENEILSASSIEYETQANVINSIKRQDTFGSTGVNLLTNGGFEELPSSDNPSNLFWERSNGTVIVTEEGSIFAIEQSSADVTDETDEEAQEAFIDVTKGGSRYLRLGANGSSEAYAVQYVKLTEGTYTLSFQYLVSASSSASARVDVLKLVDFSDYTYYSDYITVSPEYSNSVITYSTTFDIGADVTNVGIKIIFDDGVSSSSQMTMSVDNVMLEKNIGASGYNMIKFGGAEETAINKTGWLVQAALNYWSTETGRQATIVDTGESGFGKAISVPANLSESYVSQVVFQETDLTTPNNPGTEFVLTGYAKASQTVLSDSSNFGLTAIIYYRQDDGRDISRRYYFEFLQQATDWQFLAGGFYSYPTDARESDGLRYDIISKIEIVCQYSFQAMGTALFDNLCLTQSNGGTGVAYYYNEDGTLAVAESSYYWEAYEYNEDENISVVKNSLGEYRSYEYMTEGNTNLVEKEWYGEYSEVKQAEDKNAGESDELILKYTPKTLTEYEYESFGAICSTSTYHVQTNSEGQYMENWAFLGWTFSTKSYYTGSTSKIYGRLKSEYENLVVTVYDYDEQTGRLLRVINENEGVATAYEYDGVGNIIGVEPMILVSNDESSDWEALYADGYVTYGYDSKYLLTEMSTNTENYSFTYDIFGNVKSVIRGDTTLVTYDYDDFGKKVVRTTYSTGHKEYYVYDTLENLIEVRYNINGVIILAHSYDYTSSGLLYKSTDHIEGKTLIYNYDTEGKLTRVMNLDGTEVDVFSDIRYDTEARISDIGHTVVLSGGGGIGLHSHYQYNINGSINQYETVTDASYVIKAYSYDAFGYLLTDNSEYICDDTVLNHNVTIGYGLTNPYPQMGYVESYSSAIGQNSSTVYEYDYIETEDRWSYNITSIDVTQGSTTYSVRYKYDHLDRLIREDNELLDKTYIYEYDDSGNITLITEAEYTVDDELTVSDYISFWYTSSGDRLNRYRGVTITYDSQGNPLSYYNGQTYTFTWNNRRLESAVVDGQTLSFTYNKDGIRTSKTVNGVTTTYYLNGSQILAEETNGNVIAYVYDAAGAPIGMQYHGADYAEGVWDIYWYDKNLQGDIVGVYNQAGMQLASYKYNAWGTVYETYLNGGADTSAAKNPFLYRGYYYDRELNMYYLGARYYDPAICRFISPDSINLLLTNPTLLTDKNLYAYCDNNPVTRVDDGGEFWETAFDVLSLGASIVEVVINPYDPWAWIGLAGDALDLIPYLTGVGEVTRGVKVGVKITSRTDDVIDLAKTTYRLADASSDIKKATGAYEILFESGNNYVGKGGFNRAISSAKLRSMSENGIVKDNVLAIRWRSANESKAAFIDEYLMQLKNGVNNLHTYNKIWSPGRRYFHK